MESMILYILSLLCLQCFQTDGKCNRDYNTPECGFEAGDCDKFNEDYPNCDAEYPYEVGGE
jgi:hypothetical protein